MNKCFESFSMFDILTPQLPDDLLPLVDQIRCTPQPLTPEHPPANLDIILSKFLNNDQLNDIELQQLSEQERQVVQEVQHKTLKIKKRPDEYQKLFYKRAFKYAEKQFFGKRGKNKSRKMSCFYHHYFGYTAQQMSVPLVNFYHPDKKTRPGLRVGQKSFNKSYVRLLLKSDIFREVSRAYRGRFYEDCMAERQQKVGKFASYLRQVVNKYGSDFKKMKEVIRSSKFKIPWSNQEVAEADRRALDDLEHYQLQFSESGGDEQSGQMNSHSHSATSQES